MISAASQPLIETAGRILDSLGRVSMFHDDTFDQSILK